MTIMQALLGAGGLPPITLTVNSTVTNYNIFTSAGSPTVKREVILNITSSGVVGATGGNTSLTVGQFPTGSTITINNSGSIVGYGGTAGTSGAGGSGGDAINANYANQTTVINNLSGAFIYGGGGGGGKGGNGGTGGTGGGGYYVYVAAGPYFAFGSKEGPNYWWGEGCEGAAIWNGSYVGKSHPYYNGGGGFCAGCACYRSIYQGAYAYTSGGAGGAGGSGGNGGLGQGYSQSNTAGSSGTNGSGGSGGGTNAGAGGQGGAGGTGGSGATYGNNGSAGNTGATGNTGASGNNGGGSAGSGGTAGSGGGSAGRYLVKGANSVTLNNSGTVAGGLA